MEHILHFPRRIIQRPGISKIRSSGQMNAILAVGLTKLKCFYALATSTGHTGRQPLPWLACNVARALFPVSCATLTGDFLYVRIHFYFKRHV